MRMEKKMSATEPAMTRRVSLRPSCPEWKFISQILANPQFAFADGETNKSIRIRTVDAVRSQKVREEVHIEYQIVLDKVDEDTTGIEMFRHI